MAKAPLVLDQTRARHLWLRAQRLDTAAPFGDTPAATLAAVQHLIQRKRLKLFFGYDHLFEAYVPAAKRKLGYFALPILMGDRIVAAFDLKTDRAAKKLLIQQSTWLEDVGAEGKAAVDEALGRFEAFQLGA